MANISCDGIDSSDEIHDEPTNNIIYNLEEGMEKQNSKCIICNKYFNSNYLRYKHDCKNKVPLENRPVKRHTKKQIKHEEPEQPIINTELPIINIGLPKINTEQPIINIGPPKIQLNQQIPQSNDRVYMKRQTVIKKDISNIIKNIA